MNDGLDELRASGFLQAIIHYLDGSVYLHAWKRAYVPPRHEDARPEFANLIQVFIAERGPTKLRGVDDCPLQFVLAQSEQCHLEWVSTDE